MPEKATIRPLHKDDVPALKTVIDGTGLFPSDLLDGLLAPYFTQSGDDLWFSLLTDQPGPVALAYAAPERMTEGTWNLLLIAVHPTFQARGYGTQLVRHVEHELSKRKQRLLLVETSGLPEFAQTRSFYLARGYRHEATICDYYRQGEDKLIFTKALAAGQRP